MSRSRSPALLLLAIVLAGATGYWLGLRRAPLPEVMVVACPEMERCPATTPAQPAKTGAETRPAPPPRKLSQKDDLPALAPVDEPREALLRYVREHADSLSTCVAGSDRARLTLQLEVVSGGAMRSVKMLDGNDAARRASRCVSERLREWVLPAQWVPQDRTLIVSLVL